MDCLRNDRGRINRNDYAVIRQRVPVEVLVGADLEHCERRSLRGIDQWSTGRVPPAAIERHLLDTLEIMASGAASAVLPYCIPRHQFDAHKSL